MRVSFYLDLELQPTLQPKLCDESALPFGLLDPFARPFINGPKTGFWARIESKRKIRPPLRNLRISDIPPLVSPSWGTRCTGRAWAKEEGRSGIRARLGGNSGGRGRTMMCRVLVLLRRPTSCSHRRLADILESVHESVHP